MNRHRAFCGERELKRGDTVHCWPEHWPRTFAYVADDGVRVATQEPGELPILYPIANFPDVRIEKERVS